MKLRLARVLFVAALPLLTASAGGSVYSRYGYGDLLLFGGTRSFAMGNTGIGMVGDGFINRLNPAGLARIPNTRFSGSFFLNSIGSTGSEGSSSYSNYGFQGFSLAIPIAPEQGITFALESTPVSQVSYAIQRSDSQQSVYSTQSVYGSGGLSKLAVALSYAPTREIHTGLRLNYNFGRLRQYTKTVFTDASFTNSEIDRSLYLSGYNLTLGTVVSNAGQVFGIPALNRMTVGMILTTPVTMTATREDAYSAIETTLTTSSTATLPWTIGFGMSTLLNERTAVAGDLVFQNWSGTSIEGAAAPNLRNALRISAGVEYLPERMGETFWQRIVYRAGAGYHQTYYSINGTGIDELFVTGGLGLPISHDARLNLGLQVGFRGTTSNNLQRDMIIRFSAGISASETWFMKIDEE